MLQTENYKYKTELHAHTKPVSGCSDMTAERLLELYKQRDADAVVLTNHYYDGYFERGKKEEMLKLYVDEYHKLKDLGKKCGINIILGMEIRFTENINDYLIYGIDEEDVEKAYDYLGKGIDEFYKGFKNDKNVILQAHPFRQGMHRANSKSIDGIEVFNMHPNHNSGIAVAAKYARENNFLISGGTDFHHENHQGCCFVKSKELPETSYDIANLIKSKDFVFDIFGNIVLPYNM